MSNTKQYSLTKLREEHTLFLKTYATIIKVKGEVWYHLPNYYREEKENFFEVLIPSQVPNEVKSFFPSENINAELLEALEMCINAVGALANESIPANNAWEKAKAAIKKATT